MPRYSYKCENESCEFYKVVIEESRTVEDRNKKKECKCGEYKIRVVDLPSSPQFRGSGFTPKFHS